MKLTRFGVICMIMKMKDIDPKKIKVCGRTIDSRDPICLIWTGSFVEFNVKASEFKVLIEGPYDTYESWIAIEINGEVISRRMVLKEKEWITVFRMMNPENITNVKIIKEVQAFGSDSEHRLNLYEIETDGELMPVSDKLLRIEFIGDSINSAEGCVGATCEMDWIAQFFSHTNSYPYMVGKKLGADIRVFSQSGWGVYASWDCNTDCVIPKYYEGIASLMAPGFFDRNGFNSKWDFASWQPHVVIINLGTNDNNAFHNEDCATPDVLRMNGEKYNKKDRIKVRNAIVDFIKMVRKNNPDALIYWAYGMLDNALEKTILEAIEIAKYDLEDKHIGYIQLPKALEKELGSRYHPGVKAHKKATRAIVKRLKSDVHIPLLWMG